MTFSKGRVMFAAPGSHEAFPDGVGVREGQATSSLIAAVATLSEVQHKVFGRLQVSWIFGALVLIGKEVPLSQDHLVEAASPRDNWLANHTGSGVLDLLVVMTSLTQLIS